MSTKNFVLSFDDDKVDRKSTGDMSYSLEIVQFHGWLKSIGEYRLCLAQSFRSMQGVNEASTIPL